MGRMIFTRICQRVEPSSIDQGGEDVPDISAVLADHGDRIAAVVLAQEGTAEAELEGLAIAAR